MEGLDAHIIVWISLTAIGIQDSFTAQAIFKRLAPILASMEVIPDDSVDNSSK